MTVDEATRVLDILKAGFAGPVRPSEEAWLEHLEELPAQAGQDAAVAIVNSGLDFPSIDFFVEVAADIAKGKPLGRMTARSTAVDRVRELRDEIHRRPA